MVREGRSIAVWMKAGDVVRIEVVDAAGQSVFGAIEQRVRLLGEPAAVAEGAAAAAGDDAAD
jgi:fumarylacetoacetate (FAA) hydrolase